MASLKEILLSKRYEHILVTAVRLGLAVIFIWFGVLKIAGFNPVFDLVYNSALPWFVTDAGLLTLGIIEALIGILLLLNRAIVFTHIVVLIHLLGTFSTFIFGWHVVFDPHFPVLSLDGEFVVKNIVLALAGLGVLVYEGRRNLELEKGK